MNSRQYTFTMHDAPASLGTVTEFENTPVAVAFLAGEKMQELCRRFGFLMLLSQNLEIELKMCLNYIWIVHQKNDRRARFEGDPDDANFNDLIKMFRQELDMRQPGSKEIIDDLHEAKNLRNHLAHAFIYPEGRFFDFLTPGGQNKVADEMDRMMNILYPITALVIHVRSAFAAEVGLTPDAMEKMNRQWIDSMDDARKATDEALEELNSEESDGLRED